MKNRRNFSSKEEEYFFKVQFSAINDINEFCTVMMKLDRFVIDADVRSGTYVVDARSMMGLFSLDLTKPVEVWFKIEVTEQTRTIDMDKYFAAKIEKWLVKDDAHE